MAVTIPIGISKLNIILEALSTISKKIAPNKALIGKMILLSAPNKSLAIWGIINPIQPIIPASITLKALINVATTITMIFTFSVSTPNAFASSSPKLRAFKYFEKKSKIKIPQSMGMLKFQTMVEVLKDKLPISQ